MKDLKEAEFWLDGAKKLLASQNIEREKYTVVTAMAIHSIIKANDALTNKFLKKRAHKHDEAMSLFLRLIRENRIHHKFSDLRTSILIPAINIKSKVDYKGIEMSRSKAEKWVKNAEKFLDATKEALE